MYHGKTTLSDALLHKAGLIHKDRVGDQKSGRSLDTLKDERDRGITIKSAAITLELNTRESFLCLTVTKYPDKAGSDGASTSLAVKVKVYIGNF